MVIRSILLPASGVVDMIFFSNIDFSLLRCYSSSIPTYGSDSVSCLGLQPLGVSLVSALLSLSVDFCSPNISPFSSPYGGQILQIVSSFFHLSSYFPLGNKYAPKMHIWPYLRQRRKGKIIFLRKKFVPQREVELR